MIRRVKMLRRCPDHSTYGITLLPTTLQAFPHGLSSYLRNVIRRLAWRDLLDALRFLRTRYSFQAAEVLLEEPSRRGGLFHLSGIPEESKPAPNGVHRGKS